MKNCTAIDPINAFIDDHQQAMISALQTLIAIPSYQMPAKPSMPFGEGPAKALAKALELAQELGFTTRNIDNYVGAIEFGEGEPQLGILCHLDVVPEGEGWIHPPYAGIVEDGKLYGRGSIDNKGPAVAVLYALYALKELGIPLKSAVRFLVGTDEENGSADLKYYNTVEKMPPMLFTPDGSYPVINIEKGMIRFVFTAACPTGEQGAQLIRFQGGSTINAVPAQATAVVRGIGSLQLEEAIAATSSGVHFTFDTAAQEITIHAQGKSAHASTPAEGENAVTALISLLAALPLQNASSLLKALAATFPYGQTDGTSAGAACQDALSGALTLAFSVFSFEADKMEGKIDIRFPLCQTKDGVIAKVSAALAQAGFVVESAAGSEPHHVDENSPFVQTLLRIYAQQTGSKPYCVAIGGGTYVHNTSGGVAFGPTFEGESNNMHGIDEFIVIENLLKNAKIFAHTIAELCGK